MKKNRRQSAIKLGVRLPPSLLPPSLLPKRPTKKPPSPSPLPPPTSDDDDNITRPVPGSLSVIPGRRRHSKRRHSTPLSCIGEKISIQSAASDLRDTLYYGPDEEHRFLIRQHVAPEVWTQPSSRVSWIGVWGTNTATVVSMMDKETLRLCPRPPAGRRQLCVKRVLITALADMFPEVVGPKGLTGVERVKLFKQSCSGGKEVVPFAVVSVAPGFASIEGAEFEVQEPLFATSFLNAALKDRQSLNSIETKEIATCALRCLLGSKFQADKIEMRVYGFHDGELDRLSEHEVDQYFAQMKLTKAFP